ncbi:cell division protein FtsZ [Ferrimonas sediminicola]|uniref:Cell division protein FtsZ n=1 Tax=Ferrimonas sediminicola TaxID=2569538 RepID=A0A4U1BJD1_9GAMM|nr:cell division protein FtsZ [Ferrimonas sediminicola]TKB51275.1 cell division protein FtsZ [Ferrimonas sediminicola]
MFEVVDAHTEDAVIKVIGVGGGGGNAIEHMVEQTIEGAQFIVANTDSQALRKSTAGTTIQLGKNVTKGLGAGANPAVGYEAAMEDKESIRAALTGSDMVFIAAGMGGGTGTGAAPVVAEVAKEEGILTVAVVTKPFVFEGKKRAAYAEQGIAELSKHVDSLITVPNDKLLKVLGTKTSLLEAFSAANNVLLGAVQGIAELITRTGLINVDFADVKTVMSEMGNAMMGTGVARGENRAEEAAEAAVSSPLLEDIDLTGAKGVLVNITCGMDLSIEEYTLIGDHVRAYASENATIVVGTVIEPEMSDEIRVTVVATGIGADKKPDIQIVVPPKAATPAPQPVAQPEPKPLEQPAVSMQPIRIEPAAQASEPATPTAPAPTPASSHGNAAPAQDAQKGAYLDIPAFLRKQLD